MSDPSLNSPCRPDILPLYHYGDLDATARLEVEAHLRECASCRRELSQLQVTLGLLPNEELKLSTEEIRDFNRRVGRQLPSRTLRRSRPAVGWSLAAVAAVLLVVMVRPPSPVAPPTPPETIWPLSGATDRLPAPELLLELDLLENLDLLQQLEGIDKG